MSQYRRNNRIRTEQGWLYADLKYDRCVCSNSKPSDQPFCDRCTQLHALGYRMRRETVAVA